MAALQKVLVKVGLTKRVLIDDGLLKDDSWVMILNLRLSMDNPKVVSDSQSLNPNEEGSKQGLKDDWKEDLDRMFLS